MALRVAFDATAATQGAGVGRYTAGLLRALLRDDCGIDYTLLTAHGAASDLDRFSGEAAVTRRTLPVSKRVADLVWQRLRLPLPAEWLTGRADVYHSPDYVLPPLRRAAGVVTVHDLSFVAQPQFAHPALAAYLRRAVPLSVARAAVVLADSANTAADLSAHMGVPPERLRVVYPGLEERFRPQPQADDEAVVRGRYRLERRYFLCVGTIEPRKNYVGAVAALQRVVAAGFSGDLAIAGGTGWLAEESLVAARAAGERVRLLGHVPDEHLPALYRRAVALVYPSHYEGFGFPPLEAMACGTPAIAARNSSLPEAVGDAGLYCGTDPESIAAAMLAVLGDERRRAQLVAAGLERARTFTWERAAGEVRQVYREVG
ncbi:MAG: glycosyltransferase family 4 protein [Anaerolineae bacterium]